MNKLKQKFARLLVFARVIKLKRIWAVYCSGSWSVFKRKTRETLYSEWLIDRSAKHISKNNKLPLQTDFFTEEVRSQAMSHYNKQTAVDASIDVDKAVKEAEKNDGPGI